VKITVAVAITAAESKPILGNGRRIFSSLKDRGQSMLAIRARHSARATTPEIDSR
jgi:hypothetical protein